MQANIPYKPKMHSFLQDFKYTFQPMTEYIPSNTPMLWMNTVNPVIDTLELVQPFALDDSEFYRIASIEFDDPPDVEQLNTRIVMRLMDQFGTPEFEKHVQFLVHFDTRWRSAALLYSIVKPVLQEDRLYRRYFTQAFPKEQHVIVLAEGFVRLVDMPGLKSRILRTQILDLIQRGIDNYVNKHSYDVAMGIFGLSTRTAKLCRPCNSLVVGNYEAHKCELTYIGYEQQGFLFLCLLCDDTFLSKDQIEDHMKYHSLIQHLLGRTLCVYHPLLVRGSDSIAQPEAGNFKANWKVFERKYYDNGDR